MASDDDLCGKFVYWWDGEYEGECELPEGHDGPHFDGLSWYDDDTTPVDAPEPRCEEMFGHPAFGPVRCVYATGHTDEHHAAVFGRGPYRWAVRT